MSGLLPSSLPSQLLMAALLALLPPVGLSMVRFGHGADRPRWSLPRFAALYLMLALAFVLATLVDELPTALGLLGAGLGLFGLGIGVEPLYRYLYGHDWMAGHPGAAARDVARWERVTLLLALVCLLVAVLLALRKADVAVQIGRSALACR